MPFLHKNSTGVEMYDSAIILSKKLFGENYVTHYHKENCFSIDSPTPLLITYSYNEGKFIVRVGGNLQAAMHYRKNKIEEQLANAAEKLALNETTFCVYDFGYLKKYLLMKKAERDFIFSL